MLMIDHGSYTCMAPGADTAVLMIHGIAGTPAHFRHFFHDIPPHWSAKSILLEGHGGAVTDMGKTNMDRWKRQVSEEVDALLLTHKRVFLMAHSMGTFFAIREAVKRPEKIPALFLLAVPTRPWPRCATICTALKVSTGLYQETDRAAVAMVNNTSIRLSRRPWQYLSWLPRMIELLREARQVRTLIPQLKVPTCTFQSRVDELVSLRTCKDLEGQIYIKNHILESSGHFDYSEEDLAFLRKNLQEMFENI